MGFQFFVQGRFEGGLHAGKGMAAQVGGERVGEVGLKAGIPDALNLLFDVGNGRPDYPVEWRRIRRSVYPITAKTG
jgi:hypothetical protein